MSPTLLGEFHALIGAAQDHLDNLPERTRRLPHAVTLAEVVEHAVMVLHNADSDPEEARRD